MSNATDVGSIRATMELDINQYKANSAKVKQDMTDMSKTASTASKSMKDVATSLKEAADKREQIAQLTKSLDLTNAKIEQQKKVLAALKEQYEATFNDNKKTQLEGKILGVETSLHKLTITSDTTAKKLWELEDSFEGVEKASDKSSKVIAGVTTALTALGAGAAASGMIKTATTLVGEANALGNALIGVKQVAASLGQDVNKVSDATEKLASRGVLSLTESATAIKTALATGYDLDETIALINTLTDAAAFNRKANYEWGEAVVTAIQGIKDGKSTLTDAAGITTNLSVMQDRYAKSIGTTAAKLTESQKVQAAYNGMMQEAYLYAGNANKALEGYTGTNNSFKKSIEDARVELGEAYLPIMDRIIATITPMIQQITTWVATNKEFVAGITAAGVVVTGLVATLTALATIIGIVTVAFIALNVIIGPTGWLIIGLGLATAGIAAYSLAADAAAESTWKFAKSHEELNDKLNQNSLSRTADDLRALQSDYEELNSLVERQAELRKELASLPSMRGVGTVVTEEMKELAARSNEVMTELNELQEKLRELGVTSEHEAAVALNRMREEIEASTPALRDLRMEVLAEVAAKEDSAIETKKLAARYNELKAAQKLTKNESEELTSVIRELTLKYPDLHAELDEQGRLLIVNEGLLRDMAAAEAETASAALAAEAEITASRIRTAKATVDSMRTQLTAMQALAAAEKPEWGSDSGIFGDVVYKAASSAAEKKEGEIKKQLAFIGELEVELAAMENGTWRELPGVIKGVKNFDVAAAEKKKKAKTKKEKTAEQLAQEAYQGELKKLEIRRLLGKLTEKEELAELDRLAKYYKKYDDIWIDAETRRQRLQSQMAADAEKSAKERAKESEAAQRKGFEKSAEWIEMQTRKMTEAGRSESEITKMQLDAWTRVRNRYDKDSDYYKRADKSMYDARMNLRKQDEALAKEIATKQKDATKDVLKSIDTQKKAELTALDERKKAVKDYYDFLLRQIDDGERSRERAELEAEAEKYRYATSDKGRAHYAELMEKLRKMDVEDQRTALEDERDTKLDALDQQKADIESWYDDMKAAMENFNGDMITLYELTDDARLKSFTDTNAAIKAEMVRFQAEMAALAAQAPTSDSGTVAQMAANAKAWKTADASGKAALSAENQKLGASIGATYNNGSGKWLDGAGIPLFHTGRDGETGQTFSVSDRLMPDELAAILRNDEYVFTGGQLSSLLEARGGGGTTVNIEKYVGIEMNDTVMEDEIDLNAVGRTGNDMVAAIARNNYVKGGG